MLRSTKKQTTEDVEECTVFTKYFIIACMNLEKFLYILLKNIPF